MDYIYVIGDQTPTRPNELTGKQRQRDLDIQKEQERIKEKREEKVFSSYFQLNKKALPLIDLCLAEKPKAFRLFLFLINHMDKYNCMVCSRTVLEKALGTSRSTTYEHLKYLQDLNILYTEPNGKHTQYVVNPNIIWRSKKSNLKQCPFPKEKAQLDFPKFPNNTYRKSEVWYAKSRYYSQNSHSENN